MSQLSISNLTEQQAALVRFIAHDGLSIQDAGTKAGYATNSIRMILRKPAVAAAIHEALQFELQTVLSPTAVHLAGKFLRNEAISPRVRADLIFKILDRAGHITPSNKGSAAPKALSEMTRDEMLEFINVNQAAIDKMEAELAERATDVSTPAIAPSTKALGAKSLNYLD